MAKCTWGDYPNCSVWQYGLVSSAGLAKRMALLRKMRNRGVLKSVSVKS